MSQNFEIELLPESNDHTVESLKLRAHDSQIIVCDFAIHEIAKFRQDIISKIIGGYLCDGIIIIDHHAPTSEMAIAITSTNLACDFVQSDRYKTIESSTIFLNHTDTDSLLSSSIIRGLLKPEERYKVAALAADHTGEENDIADLLEALKIKRDIGFSLRNLELLIRKQELDPEAKELLKQRQRQRDIAKRMVEDGSFKETDGIYWYESKQHIGLDFFVPLLPSAKAIVLGIPFDQKPGYREIKVRLGKSTSNEHALNRISFSEEDDFGFGGRWNAGNNKRNGGTTKFTEECAKIIAKYINKENHDF